MMTSPEPDGIVWQKSSYSGSNGGCVEVGWRTSSYSVTNGGCVQVAPAPDRVLVRDSKDPEGPALTVPTTTYNATATATCSTPTPTASNASGQPPNPCPRPPERPSSRR